MKEGDSDGMVRVFVRFINPTSMPDVQLFEWSKWVTSVVPSFLNGVNIMADPESDVTTPTSLPPLSGHKRRQEARTGFESLGVAAPAPASGTNVQQSLQALRSSEAKRLKLSSPQGSLATPNAGIRMSSHPGDGDDGDDGDYGDDDDASDGEDGSDSSDAGDLDEDGGIPLSQPHVDVSTSGTPAGNPKASGQSLVEGNVGPDSAKKSSEGGNRKGAELCLEHH